MSVVLSRTALEGGDVIGLPKLVPSTENCTLAMVNPLAAVAVELSVTVLPLMVAPAAGAVTLTVGGELLTVMLTPAEVPELPLESKATAVNV